MADHVRPNMRVHVGDNLHAGRFELRHQIRRHRFHDIHLARKQCCNARIGVRHGPQDHAVVLWNLVLVPVIRIAHELGAIARNQLNELPRPGTGRLKREFVPIPAEFFPLPRAGIENIGHRVKHRTGRLLRRDLKGVVVNRSVALHLGKPVGPIPDLKRVVLRRIALQQLVEVPHRVLRREGAAVVVFHAAA